MNAACLLTAWLLAAEPKGFISEELQPEIPLPEGRRAASYTVFVGLVVSQEELDANRKR